MQEKPPKGQPQPTRVQEGATSMPQPQPPDLAAAASSSPQPSAPPPYTDLPNSARVTDIYGEPMDIDLDFLSDDDFDSDHDLAAEDVADPGNVPPQYQAIPQPAFQPSPGNPLIDHPSSHYEAPTANHTHNTRQRNTTSSPAVLTKPHPGHGREGNSHNMKPAVEMCVICNQRPQYRNGAQSYPTCGNTCARALESVQNLPNMTMRGQMNNPNRATSSSSRPSYSSIATSNNVHGTRGQSPPTKMCEVCGTRPRCQRGGKIYPTCGLTCAAKLHPPGSVEMCDYCHQRPKVVINGRTFPQCGRTCRDKARAGPASGASKASCSTCLVCWKEKAPTPSSDFCSNSCKTVADNKAPFLLEVPRGHVSFKAVADDFAAAWPGKEKQPCPSVKKVYMVWTKPGHNAKYEEYGGKVSSHGLFKKKGNEQRRWIGTPRECGFGEPGNTTPCRSSRCVICNVVRSTGSRHTLPDGILTTPLPRAIEFSSNVKKRAPKIVLMANVLLGKPITMQFHELVDPLPPQGSDSVHIIGYHPNGTKLDLEEYIVYDNDAVKPLYLISYA